MKILYVFDRYYPEAYGGAEISNRAMVRQVAKTENVRVATLSDELEGRRTYDNVEIHYIKRPLPDTSFNPPGKTISASEIPLIPNFVKYLFDVKFTRSYFQNIVEDFKPDIIHASGVNPLFMAYELHKKYDIPYVSHLRGYRAKCVTALSRTDFCERCDLRCLPQPLALFVKYVYQNPLRRALIRSSRVITISRWMKKVFSAEGYGDIELVYNPVSFDIKPEFDPDKKRNQFFFAGRLVSRKGINELVRGFHLFHQKNKQYELKIAGRGKFPYDNIEGIDYLGVLSHDDTLREMRRSKFCVFPSKYPEPFGRVVAEAQSVGSLVLGSGRGGMGELLDYGFAVDVTPESIAKNLLRIVDINRQDYMDMVENAYDFVQKNCHADVMREKLQHVYEQVIGRDR